MSLKYLSSCFVVSCITECHAFSTRFMQASNLQQIYVLPLKDLSTEENDVHLDRTIFHYPPD